VYESLQPPKPRTESRSSHAGKAAAGATGAGLLFVLGKAKFFGVLAGLVKFKTLATMLLSIGAYAVEWGWLFAAGFVLLIFVHEMGHAVAMRLEGIPAARRCSFRSSAPSSRCRASRATRPSRRGWRWRARLPARSPRGRPCGPESSWSSRFLPRRSGNTAVLINLFNLVPVSPLDGGRIVTAFTRGYWVIGYAVGIGRCW